MTAFEWVYCCARSFDHPLYQAVYRALRRLEREAGKPLRVLDVGGRRSNYTIGLKSTVWITDLPRESTLQKALDLGATDDLRRRVLLRRSNVEDYLLDDMTRSRLPPGFCDVAVAVEVLEHVEDDEAFLQQVVRILRPGGRFVMTTPNGDFLPVPYPDHKRHYRRDQLTALLRRHFAHTDVRYVVNHGRLLSFGIRRPSLASPLGTCASMTALFAAGRAEDLGIGGQGPGGKRHLLAVAAS